MIKVRLTWKHWTGAIILVLFVWLLDFYIGWQNLLKPWLALALPQVITASGVVLLSYLVRTVRLYDYFRPAHAGAARDCVRIMLQHNLLNNLLPMRTGEISFPVLLNRYLSEPYSRSIPALALFRLMDLHVLAGLALAGLGLDRLSTGGLVLLLVLWLGIPILALQSRKIIINKLEKIEGHRGMAFLLEALRSIPDNSVALARIWLWSLLNWIVKLLAFAWVLQQFLPMDWSIALLASVAGDLTSVLPVHGIGGAGTYEAGVLIPLLAAGFDQTGSVIAAVNLHLFVLGVSLIFGLLSLLIPTQVPPGS